VIIKIDTKKIKARKYLSPPTRKYKDRRKEADKMACQNPIENGD